MLLAGLLVTAAAFYNGAPLLYADSMDYLLHGGEVVRVLFQGMQPDWWSTRSFFYCLAILPLHAYVTTWPIAYVQSLLTAWVIWMTLKTTLRRPGAGTLLVTVALLTAVSSVSWFTSYVMPDIFAPLLVLGAYLVCGAWDTLTARERIGVALLVWFAIVSHGSHMLLAGGLCASVALWEALRRGRERRWMPTVRLVSLAAAAFVSTVLIHAALLGEPSFSGRRPVFLLARVIADGPGRAYLRDACGEVDLAVCRYVDRLPDNVRDVLWSENSLWASSSRELRQRLREEELAVVVGAIRSDPTGQLRASASNVWEQLRSFGLYDAFFPDPYITARIAEALPRSASTFPETRQGRQQLREGPIGLVQRDAWLVSLGVILCFGILLGRAWTGRLAALAAFVALGILGNATITGVLSNVEARYQARIAWLVPLLACIVALAWWDQRPPGVSRRSAWPASRAPGPPPASPIASNDASISPPRIPSPDSRSSTS